MIHFSYIGTRNPRSWVKIGDSWQATDDIYIRLQDDTGVKYTFHILPGFRTDFGSIPVIFRWFVPSRSETNDVLNMAFVVHDACYSSGLVHKDLADQMLHDILIDAGISRFRAKMVKWAVSKFADSHYGPENDKDDNDLFVDLRVYSE